MFITFSFREGECIPLGVPEHDSTGYNEDPGHELSDRERGRLSWPAILHRGHGPTCSLYVCVYSDSFHLR